jgi:hypothetical protein
MQNALVAQSGTIVAQLAIETPLAGRRLKHKFRRS